MTNDQFEALVQSLEASARRSPAAYQLKVLLLALLGNAYIGLIVLLIAGLVFWLVPIMFRGGVGLLAWKLAAVLGPFLWLILKAVAFSIPEPKGIVITTDQAPELFAMIEELRRALGAPRFHEVHLDDSFNAGVVQSPRLGIFGWHRNYLLIGLPLMKALTAEQFKAVLAHEFGHLAKGHGAIGNWIYRQRLRWTRLMSVLEANQSDGRVLFKPFLNWFAPYFNAYSFPLARTNEYEADATSAWLTSSAVAAEALTSTSVAARFLEQRFWPQGYRGAEDHAMPKAGPFTAMGQAFTDGIDKASAQKWLAEATTAQTTLADTHPALSDRLRAIGADARFEPPTEGRGADRLLGAARTAITQVIDALWTEAILPSWQTRYAEVQDARRRLAELDARHTGGAELSFQEAHDRANLTASVGRDSEEALAQFRALLARAPDIASACFSLGALLLARDDDEGRALIERAITLDENATLSGCELLRDYHWRCGHAEEAQAWHRRLMERAEVEGAAAQEQAEITAQDSFDPHGLPEATIAALCERLQDIQCLRAAYLARKRVRYALDRPMYVLGFTVQGFWHLNVDAAAEAVSHIQQTVPMPGETLIIALQGRYVPLGRKLRSVPGARLPLDRASASKQEPSVDLKPQGHPTETPRAITQSLLKTPWVSLAILGVPMAFVGVFVVAYLSPRSEPLLVAAAIKGDLQEFERILEIRGNLNFRGRKGATALAAAAGLGHEPIVKALLAAGADVNVSDHHGGTALIAAAERGHLEIVQMLVAGGARLDATRDDGTTALTAATKNGREDVVEVLKDAGAAQQIK